MIELLLPLCAWFLLSALFSGAEIGLYSLSRVKLRYRLQQADRRARILDWLLTPISASIITILIGNNIANYLLTAQAERLLSGFGPWSILATTLLLTPLVLMFAEFLPKYAFRAQANRLMYDMAYVLALLRVALFVPVSLVDRLTRGLQRLVGAGDQAIWEPHTSRTNLRQFLAAESGGHGLTEVQKQLMDRVMALERLDCRYAKVSKPLSVMATIDGGATAAAVRNGLEAPYYARYLVTDHETGQPQGWLSAATLATAAGQERIAELAQPLLRLPATTSLAVALERMHQQGSDLALVDDPEQEQPMVLFRGDCLRSLLRLV